MRSGLFCRAVLTAALVLGTTNVAFAADPSPQDIAQARDLGHQGQVAFDAGNFAEAEKLFAAASNLYPAAPTLTLGLARAQAKVGKVVSAQEAYNKIIREQSQHTNLPPAFKDALEAAKSEVGTVSARVASVVISVEGAPSPQVTLDGQALSAASLGLKRPVDPGSHVVRAEAAGHKPAEVTFQVAESGSAEAKLKLEKAPDAPAGAGTPAPSPSPGDATKPVEVKTGTGSNKTLAIVALGVGGAGLAVGAVTGAIAMGKHGDLADKCPDAKCSGDLSGDIDSYKTMGTISTIGFIVGAVGVAGGAVLWLTAPKESASATIPSRSASGFSWHPYVGAGGGGVTGRF